MNPHELYSITKSLEAAMRKLEALGKGHAHGVCKGTTTSWEGSPRAPNLSVLSQRERHLPSNYSKSPTTFRSIAQPLTFPLFDGQSTRTFVSWLYDVECFFQGKCLSDGEKCEMVVSCLRDFASLWYNTLDLERTMEGKGKIRSWAELDKQMRLKYLPCSSLDALWRELRNLKRHPLRVREYAQLFEELRFVCGIEADSVPTEVHFLGLNPENADRINLEGRHSFDNSLAVVSSVEGTSFKLMKRETSTKGDRFEATKTVGKKSVSDQGVVNTCLGNEHPKSKCMEVMQLLNPYAELKGSCAAGFENHCSKDTPTTQELPNHVSNDISISPVEEFLNPCVVSEILVYGGGKTWRVYDDDKSITRSLQENEIQWRAHPEEGLNSEKNETHYAYLFDLRSMNEKTNVNACALSDGVMSDNEKGFKPHYFTPHFHHYSLIKLMICLTQLGAIAYTHVVNIDYGVELLNGNLRAGRSDDAGLFKGSTLKKCTGELVEPDLVLLLGFQVEDKYSWGSVSVTEGLELCEAQAFVAVSLDIHGKSLCHEGITTGALNAQWSNLVEFQGVKLKSLVKSELLPWTTEEKIEAAKRLNLKTEMSNPRFKISKSREQEFMSEAICRDKVVLFGAEGFTQIDSELRTTPFQEGGSAVKLISSTPAEHGLVLDPWKGWQE